MFYTKDASNLHDAFLEEFFPPVPRMTAPEQMETFQSILQESLQNECSMGVIQTVHETISAMIQEQKADKEAEPLSLGKADLQHVLEDSGVSEDKAAAFGDRFEEAFGEHA